MKLGVGSLLVMVSACGAVQANPNPDAAPIDAPPVDTAPVDMVPPHKLIFVTSQAYTGNLGGFAGADDKCQTLATAAHLTGTFKAWLSNATNSAASRLTHSDVPYLLVDGTMVAASWAGLTSGTLLHGIDRTELNTASLGSNNANCTSMGPGTDVWTNTNPNGSIGNNNPANSCGGNWSSSAPDGGNGPVGFIGVIGATNGNWTVQCGGGHCDGTAPLYCLEQ